MNDLIATPHIKASKSDFAKTVLMPGDPKRSEFVAKNFLENARLVNDIRGVKGYTGTYNGTPVSIMASGMGMPSMGIYSYELFKFFEVENIIRIGSAGGISDSVKVGDVVFALGACTNSSFATQYSLPGTFAPIADFRLLSTAVRVAERSGAKYAVGNLLSSDVFYNADEEANSKWEKMGVLAVEMEAAALYANAAYLGGRALAVCTVSDIPKTGEAMTSEERVTSFEAMIRIALDTAVSV